jgi:hypothetical protein
MNMALIVAATIVPKRATPQAAMAHLTHSHSRSSAEASTIRRPAIAAQSPLEVTKLWCPLTPVWRHHAGVAKRGRPGWAKIGECRAPR